MTEPRAATVTLLFTDLVNSTELLQRAGDEQAQRIFQAHHRVLKEAVADNGGHAVKWLGDGLMVAFPSAADAVRCAVAMQQASRRPVAGERLAIRVGLNAGEALREETDYFSMPVVVARRLCERAAGGQILCSTVISGLLDSRAAFHFQDCGMKDLKGLAAPVGTCEVVYEHDDPTALLTHTPFVGRTTELERLQQKLHDVRAGHGGVIMLVGEPGIGKTRTAEEFAERAHYAGAQVLSGRCYEGEGAPPYGPFTEAIAAYGASADLESLREDLGLGAPPLARLVPALRERLPDIPEPAALQPDEERVRLLDAVAQFLIALAARTPVVLGLDDLHWADKGSIALLRHLARFAPRHRLLLLGTYRDVEVESSTSTFVEALRALPRETTYEHIKLEGLDTNAVEQLLEMIADQKVPDRLVNAIRTETSGNPFFIREVLLQLVSENRIARHDGGWITSLSIGAIKIPEGVRQVIGRRLRRVSADTNRLLSAAAGFNGPFRFDIAAAVAGLDEAHGLSAVDEALSAQMLRPGSTPDTYDFTHALIRHTLYAELSPSRQVRLHRQIAEAMERVYGHRVVEHAAAVAIQYHRSAALPGAERGVAHALGAADQAEAAYAHDDAVTFLRIALELLPQNAMQRPRLLCRLGMALSWALNFDEALPAMREAGELIAAAEGEDAAADYLAEATKGLWTAGYERGGWLLASQGLHYVGNRRDITWVRLIATDIVHREADDPSDPRIALDSAERQNVAEVAERLSFSWVERSYMANNGFLRVKSRKAILDASRDDPASLTIGAGEYRRSVALWEERASREELEGRIANAAASWAAVARFRNALGNFAAAATAYDKAVSLAARLDRQSSGRALSLHLIAVATARYEMRLAIDTGWEDVLRGEATRLEPAAGAEKWGIVVQAAVARVFAHLQRADEASLLLEALLPALERVPGWSAYYVPLVCAVAATLWILGRTDHAEVIERNLREKVLAPDIRWPMEDARLSMAHLCALQGRYDEAVEWFAQARTVLDEQGARPLRAIVDFDEALMYHRRAAAGDKERAHALLNVALQQFRPLEMTGWIKRAEGLQQESPSIAECGMQNAECGIEEAEESAIRIPDSAIRSVFRKEGEYWSIAYEGQMFRLRDAKGLHYIAQLLRHPGREFHARELLALIADVPQLPPTHAPELRVRVHSDAGPVLDAKAKADYKRRLADLRGELEEAERFNDPGRVNRARDEIELITEQLAAATGLGGRDRVAASDAERARLAVTKRIKAALGKIRHANPALAHHLTSAITTGYFCRYAPTVDTLTSWIVG